LWCRPKNPTLPVGGVVAQPTWIALGFFLDHFGR